MATLAELWLPILLSAVIVFIASSIIHMAPLWHKSDYPKLPNEPAFADAVRPLAIPPGEYLVPRATSMAEYKTPEHQEKLTKGPVMVMTVLPSRVPSMGRNLSLWFLYCAFISCVTGYITMHAIGPHMPYHRVFKYAAAISFICYTIGLWQTWIWYWRSLPLTIKSTIDGLIYALLTAGTFGWLWPR